MIHDVDESLRALVRRDALNGSKVEVAFDAPTREWASRQNTPTVSLYLYDIREDTSRREVAWETMRGPDGRATVHRQPPRRFRLSYLITCWTQRPEDEHRLLAALLGCFLRHPVLPPDVLGGALVETDLPLTTTIALPPPADRSIADVWSALGGELKPSLDLVVTAPMDSTIPIPAAAPVLETPSLRMIGPDGAADDARRHGGSRRRSRGPLAPTDPADQLETVVAEAAVAHAEEPAVPPARAAKGKAKTAAAPERAEPPATAHLPGRRLIIRGVRRP